MAIRYSGDLTIRMRWINERGLNGNGTYRCVVSRRGKDRTVVHVGAAACITEAVDSPASYDDTARAALAFVSADREESGEYGFLDGAEYGPDDLIVRRKRA